MYVCIGLFICLSVSTIRVFLCLCARVPFHLYLYHFLSGFLSVYGTVCLLFICLCLSPSCLSPSCHSPCPLDLYQPAPPTTSVGAENRRASRGRRPERKRRPPPTFQNKQIQRKDTLYFIKQQQQSLNSADLVATNNKVCTEVHHILKLTVFSTDEFPHLCRHNQLYLFTNLYEKMTKDVVKSDAMKTNY